MRKICCFGLNNFVQYVQEVYDLLKLTRVRNSSNKLRHPRSDAYSAQQVLLNKQQIWRGWAYLDCYPNKIGQIGSFLMESKERGKSAIAGHLTTWVCQWVCARVCLVRGRWAQKQQRTLHNHTCASNMIVGSVGAWLSSSSQICCAQ